MKYLNLLKSRTVWTLVIGFIVNNSEAIKGFVPSMYLDLFNALVGLLAIYFSKISPKVIM